MCAGTKDHDYDTVAAAARKHAVDLVGHASAAHCCLYAPAIVDSALGTMSRSATPCQMIILPPALLCGDGMPIEWPIYLSLPAFGQTPTVFYKLRPCGATRAKGGGCGE